MSKKDINANLTTNRQKLNTNVLNYEQTSFKRNQHTCLQNQQIPMKNELSPMQNQESFIDLTLDGAQVSLTSAGGKYITPDARLALNGKKTPNNSCIFLDHFEIIKCTSDK